MSERNQKRIKVGDEAPMFSLPDKDGNLVDFNNYLGKSIIILYFYPKNETAGCTAEACSFRDRYELFKKAGAEVIGVSSDSIESHMNFSSKYQLPFVLLSDSDDTVRKMYGVFPEGCCKRSRNPHHIKVYLDLRSCLLLQPDLRTRTSSRFFPHGILQPTIRP